jgi:hypothetical protein
MLIGGAYALAYRMTRGGPRLRGLALAAAAIVGASAWALRPQVASLLLLALLLWLLVREREVLIPPLFALWANLHGGVVMGGLVLAAVTAVAAVWNRARFARLLLVTILSAAATALTPLGTRLWSFILTWAATSRETGVSEWAPLYPVDAEGIVFWLLAIAFCALAAVAQRRARASGAPALAWEDRVLVVAAFVLLPLATRSVRNVAPFLLIAAPAATRLTARAWPRASPPPDADPENPRLNLAIFAAATLVGIAVVAFAWTRPLPTLGWRPISAAARDAIASCPDPLYNGYNEGGTLIWFVKQKRVFIDGRHDPYPPTFLVEDRLVETGKADFRQLFARHGIRCAALAANARLADRLQAAGWHRHFADAQWIVLDR